MPNKKPNTKGLKPFKKGKGKDRDERINTNGRPKSLPDLKQILIDVLGEEKRGTTAMEKIIARLKLSASAGNIKAANLLLERGYGRVTQVIDHTISDQRKSVDENFPVEDDLGKVKETNEKNKKG